MQLNSLNCPLGRTRSSCVAPQQHRSRPSVVVRQSRRDNAAASAQPAAADRAEVVNSSTSRAPIAPTQTPTATPVAAAASQAPPLQQQRQEVLQPEKQQPSSSVQPSTYASNSDAIDGDIKIIGLGQRGISATTRLMSNKSMQSADFWVLDTDAKVLSSCGAPNTMRIPVEDDAQLSQEELSRLAGQAAVAAAAAPAQRPGSPVATCGVAFLVAGAGGIPGGSTLLLQVAAYLRRTGFFVVAALTRPFEFEGRRKLEEADALIEALQDVAQLVVVVPQGVLTRASAELTINQASAIADNTLEVSCRAILWALNVPEVLRASAGTMLWHGRDLRQYKRLLSPPLEVLLTCPGVGGLGRGLASLPVGSLAEAGLASGLSTLAEDAVAAAAESPFLEHVMPRASGVLCVLSLPQRVLSHDFSMAESALNDPEKYAIRAAVQVAAMTVVELAGRHCEEVVVCAHVRPDWPHTDPNLLCLEATLLALEDPAAAEEAAAAAPVAFKAPLPATSRLSPSSPVLRSKQLSQQQQQPQQQQAAGLMGTHRPPASQQAAAQHQQPQQPLQQQQQQQQPASAKSSSSSSSSSSRANWSAMSAIAGGSAAAAVGQYKPPAGSRAAAQQRMSSSSNRPLNPSLVSNSSKPLNSILSGGVNSGSAGSSSSAGSQQQQAGEVTLVPRMADKHVDTMVAQSLDLPPSAARWRHQQRREAEGSTRRRGSSHFPLAVIPWTNSSSSQQAGAPGSGNAAQGAAAGVGVESFVGSSVDLDEDAGVLDPPRDVRSRVAGMLQQERRQQGWVADRD